MINASKILYFLFYRCNINDIILFLQSNNDRNISFCQGIVLFSAFQHPFFRAELKIGVAKAQFISAQWQRLG
jgi:hypothetical protein